MSVISMGVSEVWAMGMGPMGGHMQGKGAEKEEDIPRESWFAFLIYANFYLFI